MRNSVVLFRVCLVIGLVSALGCGKDAPTASNPEAAKSASIYKTEGRIESIKVTPIRESDVSTPARPTVIPSPAPVGPNERVLMSWDFAKLAPDSWAWVFPGDAKNPKPEGNELVVTGEGAQMRVANLDIQAESASAFKAISHLVLIPSAGDLKTAKVANMYFYWASPTDVATNKEWPFSPRKVVKLAPQNPGDGDVLTGDLSRHPEWKGPIAALLLNVEVPPEPKLGKEDRFLLTVSSFALVK